MDGDLTGRRWARRSRRQPVDAVSTPRAGHLVEVAVGDRTLRVTPDHTMLRAGPDGIEEVPASDLAAGDDLPPTTAARRRR